MLSVSSLQAIKMGNCCGHKHQATTQLITPTQLGVEASILVWARLLDHYLAGHHV